MGHATSPLAGSLLLTRGALTTARLIMLIEPSPNTRNRSSRVGSRMASRSRRIPGSARRRMLASTSAVKISITCSPRSTVARSPLQTARRRWVRAARNTRPCGVQS